MVSNIPPFRPHTPKDSGSGRGISGQTRTPSSNRPSQFRRTMKDDHRTKPRNKDKAVDEADEEESASVFELARQTKRKQIEDSSIEDAEQKQEAFSADGEQIQDDTDVDGEQTQETSMANGDQVQEDFSTDGQQVQEETVSEGTSEWIGEVSEWTGPAEGEMSLEDFYANIDTLVSKEFSPPQLPHELKENQPNPFINASQIQQATVAASKQPPTAKIRTDKPIEKASIKQKTSSSSKSPIKKTDEVKADMAGTAPIAPQPIGFQSDKLQETQKATPSATIQEIATQIVDRIQIMRKDNETLTTITLRHPPILEGATITLATSDNAKREFNITFANLSPDAKLLLDRKLKEDSLTTTLERKGIIVHTLTTTTQPQNLVSAEAGQTARDRQDQQQQQQQQQKRQQPQTPEDEELT